MTLWKKKEVLDVAIGSSEYHSVGNFFSESLRTCRKTVYRMNERMNSVGGSVLLEVANVSSVSRWDHVTKSENTNNLLDR